MLYRIVTNKKTVIQDGKILYLSLEDFKAKIIAGKVCFICASETGSKPFNDEHVIPNWILRRYALHSKRIDMSNSSSLRYGQYTVPCCVDCNTELAKVYETPLSILFSKPYREIIDSVFKSVKLQRLIFKWLSLIFMKTHLKDTFLFEDLDRRKGEGRIGDRHDWDEIHHIHCIARSHFSKAKVDKKVLGTVVFFETLLRPDDDPFDYIDSELGKTVMLQLGGVTMIAVLNDSCASYSCYRNLFSKMHGPLTIFQSRQVLSDLTFINLNLKSRPIYRSSFSMDGSYSIKVRLSKKPELLPREAQVIQPGELLKFYVDRLLEKDLPNRELVLKEINDGKRNYLWKNDGDFHSMVN